MFGSGTTEETTNLISTNRTISALIEKMNSIIRSMTDRIISLNRGTEEETFELGFLTWIPLGIGFLFVLIFVVMCYFSCSNKKSNKQDSVEELEEHIV